MSFFDSVTNAGQIILPVAGGAIGAYFGGPTGAMAGATAGGAMSNMMFNQQNYHAQQQQYRYQKGLQRDIFAREDNSIQRRVSDLQAAGLSPVLAAGSGAGAGSVVPVKVGQREMNADMAQVVLAMIQQQENLFNTVAQRELIRAQVKRQEADTGRALAESNIAWKDWSRYKVTGLNPRNASMPGKIASDIVTGGAHAVQGTVEGAKKMWNSYDAEMYKLQKKLEDYWNSKFNKK